MNVGMAKVRTRLAFFISVCFVCVPQRRFGSFDSEKQGWECA